MTVPLSPVAVIVDPPGSDPSIQGRRPGKKGTRPAKREPNPERVRCQIMLGQMEAERSSWTDHWMELTNYILPRRGRFSLTDNNRGNRRTKYIVDMTATFAAKILSSGMMSGISSPARPWFKLGSGNPELDELASVKNYHQEVQRRLAMAFLRSNLYNALPIVYSDLGTFGTSAMAVLEDDEQIFRFYPYPIGLYVIDNDDKMRVRTFGRTFRMTVLQIVQRWGNMQGGVPDFMRGEESNISPNCQKLWQNNMRAQWIDVVQMIYPNLAYYSGAIDSKYKAFKSVYFEYSAPTYLLLEDRGFDEFPMLVPRWEIAAEDVYGSNCPGMTALGDIKQLQLIEKRIAQAIEKQVNPPVKGPTAMRAAKVSTLPGDITYVDEGSQGAGKGFTAVYQVQFDIEHAEKKQEQTRSRIERAFFADLFLMLTEMDRKEITATEIMERKEEKLLALGPVLEQLNQDFFNPLIYRCLMIMQRKGLLPPPPPELAKQKGFHIEYISIMAQAQKMVGIANMERFVSFVASLTQAVAGAAEAPETMDSIDIDSLIARYSEATGIDSRIIKPEEAVKAIRKARADAQAAAQKQAQAEQMSKTAKNLSGADMTGDSALTRMFGRKTAGRTLSGTNAPPVGPQGAPIEAQGPTS